MERAGVVWYLQMNWELEWGHWAVEKGGLSAKERDRSQNARSGEPARPLRRLVGGALSTRLSRR